MLIQEIELIRVSMPMKSPWKTAFGTETAIDAIFVRLRLEDQDGWGETAPYRIPQYSPEWATAAFNLMSKTLAPQLVGKAVNSGRELQAMLASFKGNYFAKSGLDCAWWDAYAKLKKMPLWQLIGGQSPEISVGADIPVQDSLDDLIAAIAQSTAEGFQRVKLKFNRELGINMVAHVRESFPDTAIHIDCNSAFTLDDMALFVELDQFKLEMIEQPLAHDDLIDHARLQGQLKTPICLDESITSLDKTRKAIDIGSCRWVNIKPGRVGGLTNALAIHDLCKKSSMPCWVGSMLESATGQGISMALATLPNMHYPADIFPSHKLYSRDISEPEIDLSCPGYIMAPNEPGHGFIPNREHLQSVSIQTALLRA